MHYKNFKIQKHCNIKSDEEIIISFFDGKGYNVLRHLDNYNVFVVRGDGQWTMLFSVDYFVAAVKKIVTTVRPKKILFCCVCKYAALAQAVLDKIDFFSEELKVGILGTPWTVGNYNGISSKYKDILITPNLEKCVKRYPSLLSLVNKYSDMARMVLKDGIKYYAFVPYNKEWTYELDNYPSYSDKIDDALLLEVEEEEVHSAFVKILKDKDHKQFGIIKDFVYRIFQNL